MAKPKNDYYKKLQDPRWQKRRLEVLESSGWGCEYCGADDKQLHVHHGYYEWGMDPWEYPTESLHCLCGECHELAGSVGKRARRAVGALSASDQMRLIGYAHGLWALAQNDTFGSKIRVQDSEEAEGVAVAYGVSGNDVIKLAMKNKDRWVTVGQLYKLEAKTKCRA